jgi:hypothetical protein
MVTVWHASSRTVPRVTLGVRKRWRRAPSWVAASAADRKRKRTRHALHQEHVIMWLSDNSAVLPSRDVTVLSDCMKPLATLLTASRYVTPGDPMHAVV